MANVKVAINGFGRIGRLAFRQMFAAPGYDVVSMIPHTVVIRASSVRSPSIPFLTATSLSQRMARKQLVTSR